MKKSLWILSIAIGILVLGGCAGSVSDTVADESATPAPTLVPQMETVTIFTIDASTMQLAPYRVKTDEDGENISTICELVESNLEEDDIRVVEAFSEGDSAYVVFDSTGKPLVDCDEEMELLILECFSNSILENVDDVNNVIFRTDKGAYSSEYMEFGEDEVYASR